MRAIQHRSNNKVLGAPKDWKQDELSCGALPITIEVQDGQNMISSFWRLTPVERAAIAAGADIRVTIIGEAMPPIAVSVEP